MYSRLRKLNFIRSDGFFDIFSGFDEDGEAGVEVRIVGPGFEMGTAVITRLLESWGAFSALDHPNIARLLFSGLRPDNRAYFVHDAVRGMPLVEYSRTLRLSVAARLGLFLDVCDAVVFLHQKGMLHRWIRPAACVVTIEDRVRLLDLGAGDILNIERFFRVPNTDFETRFCAPEVFAGDAATQASDVFSLGMVLWELCPDADGGLRRVIERAVEVDPNDRYRTVDRLADDLRAYLTPKPVRRRVPVAVAALLTVGMSAWAFAVVAERDERRMAYEQARAIAAERTTALSTAPGSLTERAREFKDATDALDDLARESPDDDFNAQLHLALSYQKFGEILGQPLRANLGDFKAAEHYYNRALTILEHLERVGNENRKVRESLAKGHDALAALADRRGDTQAAREHFESALRRYRRLFERYTDSEAEFRYGWAQIRLGNHYLAANDVERAAIFYRAAKETVDDGYRRFPEDRFFRAVGVVWDSFAAVEADAVKAVEYSKRAGEVFAELARRNPDDLQIQRTYAAQLSNFGVYVGKLNPTASIEAHEKAAGVYKKLLLRNPDDAETRRDYERVLENLRQARERTKP